MLTTADNDQKKTLNDRGICVVIPTYNNGGTIADVVRRTLAQCGDVIVVDDGCTDETARLLSAIEGISVVTLGRNRGKGIALREGFRRALAMGFSYAITLDGDGQHSPEDIPLLLAANQAHPGALIVGSRRLEGVERSKGSVFANRFSNFWFWVQTGRRLPDTQTGYRLYPLKKLRGLSLLTSRYEAELELMVLASWHGVELVPTPVSVYYPPQEARVSHFRPLRDFARISLLNTVLCVLAVVYGLPLRLWRWLMTFLRTAYSLLFFSVLMLLVINPAVWLYVKLRGDYTVPTTDKERRTADRLHQIIYHASRFIMLRHGIPGVRFSYDVADGVGFDRPRVVICNHQSHLDLACQLIFTPKIVFLTNDWVWRNPFYGFLIRHAEYYPVHDGIDELLPRLRSLVERGFSIAVYPEGTRSSDGRIGRFHQGAFYIAEQLGLEVLPMYLCGPGRILRKKSYSLHKGAIHLEVGEPVSREQLQAMGELRQQASAMRRHYIRKYETMMNKFMKVIVLSLFTIHYSLLPTSARQKLTPYPVEGSGHPAVIVCPGGSYFWHATETEGHMVARWLQQQGIAAFVLYYRTAYVPAFITRYRYVLRGTRYPDAQDDLLEALRHVRAHADEYGVDSSRVGVMGFSAGGHLVMSAAEVFDRSDWPAFIAPIYPVVTMLDACVHKRSRRGLLGESRVHNEKLLDSLSLERHVPDGCPPVFLVNCKDDPIVDYRNSVLLDSALTAHRVPHVYLQYQTGGHGFGASDEKGTAESRQWRTAFLEWIRGVLGIKN